MRAAVARRDSQRGPGHRWRRWRGWVTIAALAGLAGLAGCGTSAPPRTFSLLPAPPADGAPAGTPVPGAAPVALAIDAVSVPAAVDQPQWLLRLPDQRLVLLEQTLWASPLRDELRTALRERLARQWAATDTRPPLWRLRVELSRFESVLGREAWLEGRWTLQPGGAPAAAGAPTVRCALLIREGAGAGLPALAEAHRRAVQQLADQVGPLLRAPRSAPAPGCTVSEG